MRRSIYFRAAPILAISLAAIYPSFGQTGSLTLSSAVLTSSRTVSLNLSLTSPAGSGPAGVQWTLTFSPTVVTINSVTAATSLTAANKSVTCASASGTYTCLAYGMNSTIIANGVVAVVSVTLAASATSASIGVSNALGASPAGSALPLTATGGSVTSAPLVSGVSSVSCTPTSLTSGASSTCTVAVSSATSSATTVQLTDNSAVLTVPASVSIAANATSATFTATAGSITALQTATITATLGSSSAATSVSLVPLTVVSVTVSATSVVGGNSLGVTVTLSGPAPSTGAVVTLSGSTAAFPSTSVTLPSAATSRTFSLPTAPVTAATITTIRATYNGSAAVSSQFTVNPAASASGAAAFVRTDVTTLGSWKGAYGFDGYHIFGDTASYPSYVTATPSGYSSYVWEASTSEARGLQKAASPTDRVAACWYTTSSFTIDLAFHDSATHQVAIYLVDWTDWFGRTEQVDILDASQQVLDTRSVSSFTGGEYVVWNLSGHVIIRLTNTNPASNAVISGLFFSSAATVPPPSTGASATFVKTDTATAGSWKGAYGAEGYSIVSDTASYPAYATTTPSGDSTWTWSFSTNDPRALQKAASATDRVAACWYAGSSFSIDLALKDGVAHQVALYLLDFNLLGGGRAERVDILDTGGRVLDTRSASGFGGGVYLVWKLSGHVVIRLTNTNPAANAVVSGLFFDADSASTGGAAAAFVKADNITAGSWKGVYGADGRTIVSDSSSDPAYVAMTPSGSSSYVWAASTGDVRALQKSASATDRIAACWYSTGSFTVDLSFKDAVAHQVALYFLDFTLFGGGRSQQVEILDASGKVMDTRALASFSGGRYLVWNLSGHVVIRVTNTNPASNAVLSGVFFR